MDKYIKQEWIEALRSEKYKQCFGQSSKQVKFLIFWTKTQYCAVGLLRKISGVSWSLLLTQDQIDDIVILNDTKHLSFIEIADYIDKNL